MEKNRPRNSPSGLALTVLRLQRGWSPERLANVCGMARVTVISWENGTRTLDLDTLHRLAAHMDFAPIQVEGLLLGTRSVVEPLAPLAASPLPVPLPVEAVRQARLKAVEHGLAQIREEESRLLAEACAGRIAEERGKADALVRRLLHLTPEAREDQRKQNPGAGFHSWAFVERACEQSLRELPRDPQAVFAWAVLALHSSVASDPAVEARMIGYSHAFLGNAHRAAGKLDFAEAAFGLMDESWEKGRDASALPLAEWRIRELDAALQRDLGKGEVALILHDRALEVAPQADRPLLLLGKAETLEGLGQTRECLEALLLGRHALGDGHPLDLRLQIVWRLAELLSRLGRIGEAVQRLNEVQKLELDARRTDLLGHCLWIRARCKAAIGAADAAIESYQQARHAMQAEQRRHPAVEVTLELIRHYLKLAEIELAEKLTEELGWALKYPGLSPATLTCLRKLQQAPPQCSEKLPWVDQGLAELRRTRPRSRP